MSLVRHQITKYCPEGNMTMEHGGALVEWKPFDRMVVGSNPALAATYTDIVQGLNSQLPVALQRETPEKYPCCVGSASE